MPKEVNREKWTFWKCTKEASWFSLKSPVIPTPKSLWFPFYIQCRGEGLWPFFSTLMSTRHCFSLVSDTRELTFGAFVCCGQANHCSGFELWKGVTLFSTIGTVVSSATLFSDSYSNISVRCQLCESPVFLFLEALSLQPSILEALSLQPSMEHLSLPSPLLLLHLSLLGAEMGSD